MMNVSMECINYGTSNCATCSTGQRAYCKIKHKKLQDGTFNLADDYWDYISNVVDEDDDI